MRLLVSVVLVVSISACASQSDRDGNTGLPPEPVQESTETTPVLEPATTTTAPGTTTTGLDPIVTDRDRGDPGSESIRVQEKITITVIDPDD